MQINLLCLPFLRLRVDRLACALLSFSLFFFLSPPLLASFPLPSAPPLTPPPNEAKYAAKLLSIQALLSLFDSRLTHTRRCFVVQRLQRLHFCFSTFCIFHPVMPVATPLFKPGASMRSSKRGFCGGQEPSPPSLVEVASPQISSYSRHTIARV
jgi:hypothetical protein